MSATPRKAGTTRMFALTKAEFLKIWASRIPPMFLIVVPIVTCLFVFELYHVEGLGRHLVVRNALDTLPVLFFATSKTLLFHAAVIAFAAFWTTVDSQYGMIRVACSQPISRVEYLVAKWCAIGAHVAVITTVFLLSHVGFTAAYSGLVGIDAAAVAAVARFTAQALLFTLAFAWVTMAAASFRRTVGSGLVTAFLAFIALALMTMIPFDVLPPRLVFVRYFFFPLGELPNPWPTRGDSAFVRVHSGLDFCLTVVGTPLAVSIPAMLYFRRRDITE